MYSKVERACSGSLQAKRPFGPSEGLAGALSHRNHGNHRNFISHKIFFDDDGPAGVQDIFIRE